MTRVALYARYSSDDQRDGIDRGSVAHLPRAGEAREMEDCRYLQGCGDFGASMILRPGIQTLLRDAQARQFDVVLADALDRISRDQADTATLFKHLKFAGVPIGTLAEGEISELHVGLKGHNERAVPERSCCQNASRRARPHRVR
jgi:site-specific DNA recombinase